MQFSCFLKAFSVYFSFSTVPHLADCLAHPDLGIEWVSRLSLSVVEGYDFLQCLREVTAVKVSMFLGDDDKSTEVGVDIVASSMLVLG